KLCFSILYFHHQLSASLTTSKINLISGIGKSCLNTQKTCKALNRFEYHRFFSALPLHWIHVCYYTDILPWLFRDRLVYTGLDKFLCLGRRRRPLYFNKDFLQKIISDP